jgi:hypothetical protein
MSFDSNSSTHIANYVTIVEDVNITLHSKSCGYPLFRITDKITNEEYSLGIIMEDWDTYFKIPIDNVKVCLLSEQKESHFYACLTKEVLEDLVKIKSTYIETYVAQRMIFGDKVPTPRKRLEFEIGYQLISKLSDLLVFKHQENILNYQADFLVELKNNLNRDIPSIVIEIDEDGHNDRTPAMEQFRQNVIEYFNNRFIRIPVNRNASQEEINKIVIETERRIRDLSKELTLEYTVDINEDDFIKQLEDHNIDKDFIKKFLNGDSGDKVFKYTHQEIGEFLGYPITENYESFRKCIKGTVNNPSVFVEGIDYKKVSSSEINFGARKNHKTRDDNRATGGAGHNKVTYLITRTTFNRICINAHRKPRANQIAHCFAVVYEVAVAYVQRLREKNIKSGMNTAEKHEQVKERINQLVTQNVKKTNVYKMTTELEEMKNKLEEMTRERDDYKEQAMLQQISLNDLRKKLDALHQLDSEKTHELNKLYKKKDCLSNLEKAIEYINIEIKRNKKIEEEYTSESDIYSDEDEVESNDVKIVMKADTKTVTKTVKAVTKVVKSKEVKADTNVVKPKSIKANTKIEPIAKPKNVKADPKVEPIVKPKDVKAVTKVVKPKYVKIDPKVEPIVKPKVEPIVKPKEVKAVTKVVKPKSVKAVTKVEPIVVEPIVVEPIVVEPIVVEPIVVEPIVVEPKYTLAILKKKTIVELKEICRSNKICGYSSKKKDELITFMLAQKNIR